MRTASDTLRPPASKPADIAQLPVVPATIGDHAAIEHLLSTVFQQPCAHEFQSQLEDPSYEPTDRLLIKRGEQVLGHIRLSWRTMAFGLSRWTLCRLSYLSVLPEYRSHGLGGKLIAAAEQEMDRQSAVVGELDTEDPQSVVGSNWLSCQRHVFSQASPRDILAQLKTREEELREGCLLPDTKGACDRLSVRHWRHVELPALMRIYQANAARGYGYLERSEAFWRWLISRRAFDQIFVAIEGRDRLELEEKDCRIVGYAVTRRHQILELMVEPDHPSAAQQLLARACGDAIERDWHTIRLHAPADEPLHEQIRAAGGSFHAEKAIGMQSTLVHVPREEVCVRQLAPELADRARQAGLSLPVELGFAIDKDRWLLSLTDHGATLVPNRLGRSYLTCARDTWIRMLTGYADAPSALAAGSLQASTALAEDHVLALFPQVPMWRPRWDDLPVA